MDGGSCGDIYAHHVTLQMLLRPSAAKEYEHGNIEEGK